MSNITEVNLNDKINNGMNYANTVAINTLPAAVVKGMYIDLPVNLLETSLEKIPTNLEASVISYQMRYEINGIGKFLGINKYLTALATCPAGYYKYTYTGQNPYVGCVNIVLYELCNQINLCANNKYINTAFTVSVEALDATVQTSINLLKEDTYAALLSALRGFIKIGAIFKVHNAFETIKHNAKAGAKVGALIEGAVYLFYVPSLELMNDKEKSISNSYVERGLEYVGTVIEKTDMYTDEL